MIPRTKLALAEFHQVLSSMPIGVQRAVVAVVVALRAPHRWLGLSATADDATIQAAIAAADDQAILHIATVAIADIITGADARRRQHATDHAGNLDRMAAYLRHTPPDTAAASIQHRLDAELRARDHQRQVQRARHAAQEQSDLAWAREQAARAAQAAQQQAHRAAQRAAAIGPCKAGTEITTEGGHTVIFATAESRPYRCTRCQATWTRMPAWESPCAGEPPPASPREAQARRIRDALLQLPDSALAAVGEQAGIPAGPDTIASFRAIVPTLAESDWWDDLIPALITWLRAEPYGVALRDRSPQAGLAAVEPLLKVLQRLGDLHRGRPVPITTTTAATYLGVTVEKVRAWIADGTLPFLETVKGDYGRGSVKYVLDCADVIAARTSLAADIALFHQRRQRGLKAVDTAVQHGMAAHTETLERIQQLGDPIAPLFRAAYYCWHLNHYAKARTGVQRSICYAMKDRVLAALVASADLSAGHAGEDGWLLPLDGAGEATIGLAWHPTEDQTYLSIVISGPGFRFPFHARQETASAWLPADLQPTIPQQPLSGDRRFTFGGRPATWIEERVIPYATVAEKLCAWWCRRTGRSPAEFTARLPSQLRAGSSRAQPPWRQDGWGDDPWATEGDDAARWDASDDW
ncbi:MAG TPA: hypothetical protein VFZ66_27990 [Herpetosiphonaceae bacterium]